MKKAKLQFVDWGTVRPKLTPQEARWWREFFRKTVKIGFELEYNLKKDTGICHGDAAACPCVKEDKEKTKCYTKCKIGADTCTLISKPEECPGVYCVEFVSPCLTCKEAVHDCSKCVYFADPDKQPHRVRDNIIAKVEPNNNLLNPKGVYSVTTDGSLVGDGGIEVVTVGRRVDFDKFRSQLGELTDLCKKGGAFVNERTSVHMHMLVGYYNLQSDAKGAIKAVYRKKGVVAAKAILSELEEPIPEIILANFHQLVRRYHNALTWLTSTGHRRDKLTRWMKFRQPVFNYSALRKKMPSVTRDIAASISDAGKYAFVNYHKVEFNEDGQVSKFHIEARFADGNLSPTAISAFGVLLHAMLTKAASTGVYGVLSAGEKDYIQESKSIMSTLLNNNGGYGGPRHSSTDNFWPFETTVIEQTRELIQLMRSELAGYAGAYEVLLSLAERPCSIRLINGDDWDQIEKDLSALCEGALNETDRKVLETVDTSYVMECDSVEQWLSEVIEDIGADKGSLYASIEKLVQHNYIRWDEHVGAFVRF